MNMKVESLKAVRRLTPAQKRHRAWLFLFLVCRLSAVGQTIDTSSWGPGWLTFGIRDVVGGYELYDNGPLIPGVTSGVDSGTWNYVGGTELIFARSRADVDAFWLDYDDGAGSLPQVSPVFDMYKYFDGVDWAWGMGVYSGGPGGSFLEIFSSLGGVPYVDGMSVDISQWWSAAPSGGASSGGIVSLDGSGNVVFSPGSMVRLVLVGVIAAIGCGTSLVVLWIGVRWLWRAAAVSQAREYVAARSSDYNHPDNVRERKFVAEREAGLHDDMPF